MCMSTGQTPHISRWINANILKLYFVAITECGCFSPLESSVWCLVEINYISDALALCVCVRIWNGFYICVRLAWFTSHKHTPHWPHTSDEEEQSALCLDINDQLVPKQNASSDWMRHHAHSHHSIAQRSHTSGTPNWNPRDSISPNTLAICVLNTLLLVYCLTLYVMFAITLHYRRCQRQVWMDGCDRERERVVCRRRHRRVFIPTCHGIRLRVGANAVNHYSRRSRFYQTNVDFV